MIFQEMGWRGMHWIGVARDMDRWLAVVNAVMTLQVPGNMRHFLTS